MEKGGKLFLPLHKNNYFCLKATVAASSSNIQPETLTLRPSQSNEKFPRYCLNCKDLKNTQVILDNSNAVAKAISSDVLWGSNITERSLIYQWIEFADVDLNPAVCAWAFPFLGLKNYNKQEIARATADLEKSLLFLNNFLLRETYLVGDWITQADIACAAALLLAFQVVLDESLQKKFANVTRWFKTVVNQPSFRKELGVEGGGDVSLCCKSPTFDKKVFDEMKRKLKDDQLHETSPNSEPQTELSSKPKSAAQLKKDAKRKEKMEKFQAKAQKMKEQKQLESKKPKSVKSEKKPVAAITYDKNTPPGEKKDISGPLPDSYSPMYVEAAWYQWWEKMGFFKPEYGQAERDTDEKFVMCLPPPNVTGSLHLGHALTNTVQDVLARWHRMKGKAVLWNPGTDHAGIATQVVVEKKLWKEKQISRHDIGRAAFVDEVWKWKKEKGNRICTQLRKLGSSLDWDREFFTMDRRLSHAVKESFIRLHARGIIFRSNRLVNWSCALKSAISDIEVNKKELTGRTLLPVPGYADKVEFGVLVSFAYRLADGSGELVVATTRIETMLADTAVAVHPDDPRYKHVHGKSVKHPFCSRLLPVVCDTMVERDFGTGAVKITPAHDANDYDCGKRHGLEFISMLTDEGLVAGTATEFDGMKRFAARTRVIDALKREGLYRGTEDNPMVVPMCSRTKDIVEPMVKVQWFMDCQDVARRSVEVVKRAELEIVPDMFCKTWYHWLDNIRDWCISRQLWWGHRIPAYFVTVDDPSVPPGQEMDGKYWVCGHDEQEARRKAAEAFAVDPARISLRQDEDVLDTWYSSGLLPFTMCGWPDQTEDLDKYFPGTLLETGHDILFFWIARMVFFSLLLTDKLPFKTVYLHAMVRDAHGRKMSKSLGNVIDPLDVVSGITLEDLHKTLLVGNLDPAEVQRARDGQKQDYPNGIPECGCDALRFALFAYTSQGRDINLDVGRVLGYRHFCNKLWNAFKFSIKQLGPEYRPPASCQLSGNESRVDMWILHKLTCAIEASEAGLATFHFPNYTTAAFNFWLYELCDVYLECLKPVFSAGNQSAIDASRGVLYTCLDVALRLTQPLMPFLTEELWQRLPRRPGDRTESVCVARWPQAAQYNWRDEVLDAEMEMVMNVVKVTRSLRADYNLTKTKAELFIRCADDATAGVCEKYASGVVQPLSYSSRVSVQRVATDPAPPGCAVAIVDDKCDVNLVLKGIIDLEREVEKLRVSEARQAKKLTQLRDTIAKSEYKSKVPADVQLADAEKAKQLEAELAKMKQAQEEFSRMLAA